jgi:hypothetical protein
MTAPQRALCWLLAALWLALALPHIDTRYSFDWDSSQFERGVRHFDIARHQPHPPGYPLWILALRALAPITGHVNSAQVTLALLFTVAGLLFFASFAREVLGARAGLAATVLLAFSPLVCVNAMAPLNYAVDLFTACAIAWMALRLWRGQARWAPAAFALAAVAAGFRPSGVAFLLPLLAVAWWRARRTHPLYAAAGIASGAVFGLAWFVPTALVSGGFARLATMDREQLLVRLRETSVFFGARPMVHAHMIVDVCLYFALALSAFAPLLFRRPSWQPWPIPRAHLFLALWLVPNLAFILLFHCGEPGYVVLSLPPLVLLGVKLVEPAFDRLRWIAAVVAVSLAAGYFPYERFINPAVATAAYQLLRASPRMPGLVEAAQRQLREQIDALPGRPDQKLIFCLRDRTEAPNIRTVTEEYPDVLWATVDGAGQMPKGVRSLAWLCDGAGLPPPIRSQFPQAHRLAGNALYSFWALE